MITQVKKSKEEKDEKRARIEHKTLCALTWTTWCRDMEDDTKHKLKTKNHNATALTASVKI